MLPTKRNVVVSNMQSRNHRIGDYSRSSRKRPPRKFEKVVVIRDGRLQEYALVSGPTVKQ